MELGRELLLDDAATDRDAAPGEAVTELLVDTIGLGDPRCHPDNMAGRGARQCGSNFGQRAIFAGGGE